MMNASAYRDGAQKEQWTDCCSDASGKRPCLVMQGCDQWLISTRTVDSTLIFCFWPVSNDSPRKGASH
eukprot:6188010-Pleurochrysis_carterae.AAC.7